MSGDLAPWVVLFLVVGGVLALDLLVVNRKAHAPTFHEAAAWSAVWVSIAIAWFAAMAVADDWAMAVLQRYPPQGDYSADLAHTKLVCQRVAEQLRTPAVA